MPHFTLAFGWFTCRLDSEERRGGQMPPPAQLFPLR